MTMRHWTLDTDEAGIAWLRIDKAESSANVLSTEVMTELVKYALRHGIISLRGDCVPKSRPWGSRWCPIMHFDGDHTSRGWVKARFVRDVDCP